jgi:hypothetical protein
MLPNGVVYQWAGSMSASVTSQNWTATLDSRYYDEPRLLWDAKPPVAPNITVSVSGKQVTLTRPSNLTGVYFVEFSVSDGVTRVKQTARLTLN